MKEILKKVALLSLSALTLAACSQGDNSSRTREPEHIQEKSAEAVDGGTRVNEEKEKIKFDDEDIAALTAEESDHDRLDDIKKRGVIRFGYTGGFAPYCFKDPETGENSGFETEIAELIAKDLGVKAEFVDMDFQSLVPATDLNPDHDGSIDVALNNHGRTKRRAEEHDFTLPYLKSVFGVWVREDSDIQKLDQLKGLKASQSPTGSTGESALKLGASELIPVTTSTDGRKMVQQKRSDFHVMDYNAILWVLKNGEHKDLRVLDETVKRDDPVGMVIAQGSPKLLNALNKSIEEHTKNGDFGEIYKKYLGEDISTDPEVFDVFKEQTGIEW